MKKIQVEILTDGEYRVTPIGFTGPSCIMETKAIEDALGVVDEDARVRTSSYHQDYGVVAIEEQQQQTC
jgi:hypothetical protein